MKGKLFFLSLLIAIFAFGFIACDSSGDSGDNLQSISTFESNTSRGNVTIEISKENPERTVVSGNFYVIFLNGNVIGRGTIIVVGVECTFQPTYGANASFTGTFALGILIIPVIPSPEGPITGFEGEESINVVGFWDGIASDDSGLTVPMSFQFRADRIYVLTMVYPGETSPPLFGSYSVSGNIITFSGSSIPEQSVTVTNNTFTFDFAAKGSGRSFPVVFTRR